MKKIHTRGSPPSKYQVHGHYCDIMHYLLFSSGFKFWRVGSRKIFAVLREDIAKPSHKKVLLSGSESDDVFQPARKKVRSESHTCPQIFSEIRDIRKDLQSLFQISKGMKLPLGIHKLLQDAFKCNICCSSPIKPPVIFSRCCKRLLGCQECVDQWFGGNDGVTRSCPLCRSERAYADTCILKGLDDLLTGILPLMNGTTVATDDSDREDLPSAQ